MNKIKKTRLDKIISDDMMNNTECSLGSFTTQNKEVNEMDRNVKRNKEKQLVKEKRNGGFNCCHCKCWVPFSEFMGTEHRNHCPFCLYSKHVDLKKSGDRKAECKAKMKPIALTFKHEGPDKWGKPRQGEIMLVHQCAGCEKFSINRIAADDNSEAILKVFEESQKLDSGKNQLKQDGIEILSREAKEKILIQLFGKDFKST